MVRTTRLLVALSIIVPAIAAPYPAAFPKTGNALQERDLEERSFKGAMKNVGHDIKVVAQSPIGQAVGQVALTAAMAARSADKEMYARELDARALSGKLRVMGGKVKSAAKGVVKNVINDPSVKSAVKTAGKQVWGAAKSSVGQMAKASLAKHGLARREEFDQEIDARDFEELSSLYAREQHVYQRELMEDLGARDMNEDMYIRDLYESEFESRGLRNIGSKVKTAAKGVAKSVINNPQVKSAVKTAGKQAWGAAKSSMGQMAKASLKKHGLTRREYFDEDLDARELEELESLYAREEDLYEREFLEGLEEREIDNLD